MWSVFPLSLNVFTLLVFLGAATIAILELREKDKFYNAKVKPFVPKKVNGDQKAVDSAKHDLTHEQHKEEESQENCTEIVEETSTEASSNTVSEQLDSACNAAVQDNQGSEFATSETESASPNGDSYSIASSITSAKHIPFPSEKTTCSRAEILQICGRIITPFQPGCEPFGENANYLASKYPTLSRPDVVRYLVARKGNVKAAEDMLLASMRWYDTHFPLTKNMVKDALKTECFFPYGRAKDGTPIVYMRGGLYDVNAASPQQYVLAAAYAIDYSLRLYPDQVNVTVIVCTDHVPGGPNQSADTTFIKLFCQVLSDNYPERLKRLAMYPFPWYGQMIWSVVKVFVDKRTQDKVMLLSSKTDPNNPIPTPLHSILDLDKVPACLGGRCQEPLVNLLDTLSD